mmetsp:Transcript_33225/g.59484  ORF Transcript_33225/g.59484 Transcript_33225/m.59484 type:complete len:229 (-) Transcript_33225:991-1677(-)
MTTPWFRSDLMARVTILSTIFSLPFASSSLAAVIQMAGSVGTASRALFRTFLAFSYVSSRASASHSSTCCGQHSTARLSRMRASSSDASSTAAFQRRTLVGMRSSAFRSTRARAASSASNRDACTQSLTLLGSAATPRASTALAFSGVCSREHSSQTSSLVGQRSTPCWISDRAVDSLPASSSNRAAAIHPGPCFGLVPITDLSSRRAFLMSLISASEVIFMLFRSVR